ncbi:MAG TPA: tetratricopeptide repeat protein [Thermoleophilia bacterium]|jgi:tetratricopeptide (TPR) repeat protein/transcriptional regulator with XRE-family HTH domain|nr:tetratricopeptide repeat protein [Thermoleophilia bacterium]
MDEGRAAFARRMARLREDAGLSQRALAREVYVDHSLITRLESGQRSADPQLASRIGERLGAAEELRALAEAARRTRRSAAKVRDAQAESVTDPAPRSAASARGSATPAARVASVLPPAAAALVGRESEYARLEEFLSPDADVPGAARVCVVTGMPGIGKTALAVGAAHRFGNRFADGCLFVDLRGFAPRPDPVSPADALALLLADLGLPEHAIPATLPGRIGLFRNETAHKRLLLILDDADSAEQINSLLPAAAGCRVVVTSRRRLPALDDADVIALGPLSRDAGAALFRRACVRAGAWDAAVRRIVGACGGHPLAIRILAARCRADASLTPELLATKLTDARGRMQRIEDGERSIADAFDVSFALLPAGQQRLFALLGLHPPFEFDACAVSALADRTVPATERMLEQLFLAGLLEPGGPGRYRMHDLLVHYAGQVAERALPKSEIHAAVGRLLDATLLACHEADKVVRPHRYRVPLVAAPSERAAHRTFTSAAAAHSWLAGSLDTLSAFCETALEYGYDEHCWQLAYTLRGIFFIGKHWAAWERTHEVALTAARRLGDPRAQGVTLNNIGLLYCLQGRYGKAHVALSEAIGLFRAAKDPHGEFTARSRRAWMLHCIGRYGEALAEQSATLAFHQRCGSPRTIAIIKRDMAATEVELCRIDDAIRHLRDAADAFSSLGLPLDMTMTLNALGEATLRSGDYKAAERHHEAALAAAVYSGSAYERARAHAGLGRLARLSGRPARARHQLTRAVRLYRELGASREAEDVEVWISTLIAMPRTRRRPTAARHNSAAA